METIVTQSEDETILAGEKFSERLDPGDVVALIGDLGSGKTRFAKGISKGLGVQETVASPTFTIINEHHSGKIPVYHFDFYRLKSITELDEIGFEEYLYGNGVCLLEWADMIQSKLPEKRFDIHCSLGKNNSERIITIEKR